MDPKTPGRTPWRGRTPGRTPGRGRTPGPKTPGRTPGLTPGGTPGRGPTPGRGRRRGTTVPSSGRIDKQITPKLLQQRLRNTPRSFKGNHNLTQLPVWIKNEIKANSSDGQLNMHNYYQYLGILREKEREEKERREKEPQQLAADFLAKAMKLQENRVELRMYKMADRLTSPRLESYLQYSRKNREFFLIALRKLLVELGPEKEKEIMTYLQPLQEGVIDTKDEPILLRMFFKGGNAFLVNGVPPYHDTIQSGGTARMAKSRQMGGTRKGKGRKGSKDGKKTRRARCWTRRNRAAQKYVVCTGSQGQKSMRYKRKLRSRK